MRSGSGWVWWVLWETHQPQPAPSPYFHALDGITHNTNALETCPPDRARANYTEAIPSTDCGRGFTAYQRFTAWFILHCRCCRIPGIRLGFVGFRGVVSYWRWLPGLSCGWVAGAAIAAPAPKAVFARGYAPSKIFLLGYRLPLKAPFCACVLRSMTSRPRVCVLALMGCGSSPEGVLRAPCKLRLSFV